MQKLRRGHIVRGAFERSLPPSRRSTICRGTRPQIGLLDVPDFAVRVHDNDQFSIRKDRNIGVMGDEDHLPFSLQPLNRVYDRLIDEMIVQVVFRLVNDQWVVGPRSNSGSRACISVRATALQHL